MYAIQRFIKENKNWKEILQRPPYSLKINEIDDLVIFKYSQLNSDFSIPLVCEARGIILEKKTWKCVCKGFNKFFNYAEPYAADIDWNSAYITQKIDGSLIKVFYYNNEWRVATNGNIDARLSSTGVGSYPTYYDLFMVAIKKYSRNFEDFTSSFKKECSYLFELVSPYNRVVIPYKKFDIYFLSEINNETGDENNNCEYVKANIPIHYSFKSLEEIIEVSQKLPWDEEGYVVLDKNYHRIKVKSPEYVLAHYVRNNNVVTDKRLIQIIRDGEEDEFLTYGNEYRERLESLKKKMIEKVGVAEKLRQDLDKFREGARADYAKEVQKKPDIYRAYLYKCYDLPQSFLEFSEQWSNEKWESFLNS